MLAEPKSRAAAFVDARDLPHAPLAAGACFAAGIVPQVRAALAEGHDVVIGFAAAGHAHSGWRLAIVQELAREAAPLRVNAVSGGSDATIAETRAFLEAAPGVTGQVLVLAGNPGGSD